MNGVVKSLLLAVALLLTVPSWAVTISVSLVQNSDGTYDTGFPAGDKDPPSATLAWNISTLTSATGLLVNSAYSDDLNDCCLSGTAEATATITIEDCSGDVAADNGWSITGSDPDQTLSNAGTDGDLPGSGAFRLRATESGDSVVTACINWSYITAPTSDTLAPPIPTGLEVTSTDTDEVTIEFDASCDNHDGTESGSGTVQYNIEIDANPTDTVAVANCSTSALAETVVGTTDSESATQTGNAWELTFGGDGVDDATDHVLLRGTTLSGDVTAIGKITGISNETSFPKIGLYIRASTTAGAAGYYIYFQESGTPKVQLKGRATADITTSTACNQTAPTLPVWLKLVRNLSANTITGFYSADGGEWTVCATVNIAIASTVQVGAFITSTTASTAVTGDIEELNIHDLARVSRAVSTMSGGSFTASAQDDDANESANSDGADGTPGASASVAKKWNPGHYMQMSLGDSADNKQSTRFGWYDLIDSNTQIQGVALRLKWSQLESSSGVFTFNTVDAELVKLKSLSVPKQLFIRLIDRAYSPGGAACSGSDVFPTDLRNNTGCIETTNGNAARIWDPVVQTRLIALYEAIAAQYDDDSSFEGMYLIRESATNGPLATADAAYSISAYTQGLKNIADGADAAFVKSNVIHSLNYGTGQTNMNSIIAHLSANTDVGVGGPDVLPTACAGQTPYPYNTLTGVSGGVDYRGAIPILYSIEASELGGGLGDCTPDQLRDFANDTLNASHLFWTRQNFVGSSAQKWDTGVLPYINNTDNDLTNVSCPSNYAQGCTP